MLDAKTIATFAPSFRGKLIQPGDDSYDEARKLYNGMIDKRPRLIARCVDAADVIAAVNFGREHGLLIHELLDAMQQGCACGAVPRPRLLPGEHVDIGIACVGVPAALEQKTTICCKHL